MGFGCRLIIANSNRSSWWNDTPCCQRLGTSRYCYYSVSLWYLLISVQILLTKNSRDFLFLFLSKNVLKYCHVFMHVTSVFIDRQVPFITCEIQGWSKGVFRLKILWHIFSVLISRTRDTNSMVNSHSLQITSHLTLRDAGGGRILPIGQEITYHFSEDHTMVTKFLDFIHKNPNYKVVKSFYDYLGRFSRNSAKTEQRLQFFGSKITKSIFFQLFHNKIL